MVKLRSKNTIFKLSSYANNPILKPQDLGLIWRTNGQVHFGAVFNSGTALFEQRVIMAARCHTGYSKKKVYDRDLKCTKVVFENYISEIRILISENGIHFRPKDNLVIRGDGTDHRDFSFGIEDVRIIKYPERFLLIGCGKIKPPFSGPGADRIAIYSTKDFDIINYHGIIEYLDSRNTVSFYDSSLDRHYMLLRLDGDIYLTLLKAGLEQILYPQRYRTEWRRFNEQRDRMLLMKAGGLPHEKEKIGPGPPPIKTEEGWLLIYHGVGEISADIAKLYGLNRKIKRGYSVCAALLDLDNPHRVIRRTKTPIYIPSAPFELYGDKHWPVDIPAVVFPVGSIVRNGKLVLYAGAGDKYVIVLSCNLGDLLEYLVKHC